MPADFRAVSALLLSATLASCDPDGASAPRGNAAATVPDERMRLRVWATERSVEAREARRRELGLGGTASRAAADFERLRRLRGISDDELAAIRAEGEAKRWADSEACRVPGDLIRAHALVVAPEPRRPLRGDYPVGFRSEIEGVVILRAVIEASSEVGEVEILKRLPAGLDEQAIREVRSVGWFSALLCGRPIATRFNVSVPYRR
jgi:hypothetical protein